MKTKLPFRKSLWHGFAAAIFAAGVASFTSCDKYDLDSVDPEGWGATIFTYLEDNGNFTNTVRLIEDLDQKEVLAKTGSKTLFVADDDAFARFFANNPWGVKKYEDLTDSQKKLLLFGAMINNSYQVSYLSSVEGETRPTEGRCLRRSSAVGIYDDVQMAPVNGLPCIDPEDWKNNNTWSKFVGRDSIIMMVDAQSSDAKLPMVHYVEDYLTVNHFENSDVNFLFLDKIDRKPGDAIINGKSVVKSNIKCSNGFIHQVADVMLPYENMATLIAKNPNTSMFSEMLDRFSAPFYVGDVIRERYRDLFHRPDVDSIFVKRYFSLSSYNNQELSYDDDQKKHADLLNFDPAWNRYYIDDAYVKNGSDEGAMNRDQAFILAPSNTALNEYFNTGAGRILVQQYGSIKDIPNNVIKELVNNNLKTSFKTNGVKSKFNSILNDANDPMNVDYSVVEDVMNGNNGVVYVTKTVFSPTSFVSVKYPTVVNKNMRIINWAIEENKYSVYLNSLNAYYSFFIPTNDAMLCYIDPASYGKNNGNMGEMWEFHYDEKRDVPVYAYRYYYDFDMMEKGDLIDQEEVKDKNLLVHKLKDVLDNCIVVNKDVEDGNEYYITKAGTTLRVKNAKAGKNGMTVEGSYQTNDINQPLHVVDVYDQAPDKEKNKAGNGKCYILDSPILTTRNSVVDMMEGHPEMDAFRELLEGSGLLELIHEEEKACPRESFSIFNSYHYTVYVPTSESIQKLHDSGKLPTWADVDKYREAGMDNLAERDSLKILDFLKYHIQDGSLFIGSQPQERQKYETAYIADNGKFDRIYATLTNDNIKIERIFKDQQKLDPTPRYVVKTPGLYNLQAREYRLNTSNVETATDVSTSSAAVIHLINEPLIHE